MGMKKDFFDLPKSILGAMSTYLTDERKRQITQPLYNHCQNEIESGGKRKTGKSGGVILRTCPLFKPRQGSGYVAMVRCAGDALASTLRLILRRLASLACASS